MTSVMLYDNHEVFCCFFYSCAGSFYHFDLTYCVLSGSSYMVNRPVVLQFVFSVIM